MNKNSFFVFIFTFIISFICIYAVCEYKDKDKESENVILYEASFIEVVDGDTIKVELDGEVVKVRLIGVNAPESVHADETQNNEYGRMASDFTADFFEDYETVYLQYDKDRQDQYDRKLCYVWLKEDVDVKDETDIGEYMFNSILIKNGYATDAAYEPNTTYADYFKVLCNTARAGNTGLWQYENFEKEVSP